MPFNTEKYRLRQIVLLFHQLYVLNDHLLGISTFWWKCTRVLRNKAEYKTIPLSIQEWDEKNELTQCESLITGCEQSNFGGAGGVIWVPPECLHYFLGVSLVLRNHCVLNLKLLLLPLM